MTGFDAYKKGTFAARLNPPTVNGLQRKAEIYVAYLFD